MSEHTFDYTNTYFGTAYYKCRKCDKRFSEYEMEISKPDCPVDEFQQGDYSEGFSFERKSRDEVRRILGNGNYENDIER